MAEDEWVNGSTPAGLATRVSNIEKGFADLRSDFRDLSANLARQVEAIASAVRGRGTNWGAIGTIGGVVVGAMLTMGTQALAPLYKDVDRHDASIETIKATRYTKSDAATDLEAVRQRFDRDENTNREIISTLLTKEQFSEFRERVLHDIDDVRQRVVNVDGNLVKRPEIEAQHRTEDQRADSLSARANTMQAQIDSFFPASKIIDEIWSQLRESRNGAPAIAPIAPIAPLAPVSPGGKD